MHLLALAYVLGLTAILTFGVSSPHFGWSRAVIAIFVLLWADVILTAQALSLFSAINSFAGYVVLSLLIAAATSWGLRFIPLERPVTFGKFAYPLSARSATWIVWFLAVSATAVICAELVLAYGTLPSNADSISYRFPRAYWYFGSGSLMHFTNATEPRPLYYPFNGTLTFLPLIHFQLGPRSFTLASLLSWFVIGLTTYLFSRDFGGQRIVAAATAWLVCLTPNVLIQSLSTNDEIIAAAPLLAGLFFLHRWYQGRQSFDAVIGIVGVAISIGTKLHVTFYLPLLLAVGVTLVIHYRAVLQEGQNWLNFRGALVGAIVIPLAAVFSLSFIAYNYLSAGRATAWEFNNQLLNTPFSVHVALQTMVLYAAQIVLTPVADLHSNFNYARSAQYYDAFNHFFDPLFGWVNNGPAFTSAFYRFVGINSSAAPVYNDLSVFIGFTWLVAILAGAWLLSHWKDPRLTWARFQLASLPVWAATFAAMTRYIDGFAAYLCYATIVAGPALVYAFAPIHRPRLDQIRWLILIFVAMTHCFFAVSVLCTSLPRSLRVFRHAQTWPVSPGFSIDRTVDDEIGQAKAGVYDHSIAWEQPHWVYMAYHPEIAQFMSRNPNPIPVPPNAPTDAASIALRFSRYVLMPPPGSPYLHVYSFPQSPAYGHAIPVRIPDKASPGETWIGNVLFGAEPEWIFAAGNNVEGRHQGRDKYVVLPFSEQSDFGRDPDPIIRFSEVIYGLGPSDHLAFRYELRIDGRLVSSTEWQATPAAEIKTKSLSKENSKLTVYVRNDDAGGTIYAAQVNVRSTKPLTLTSS
jgi:hypothetical protein